MSLLVSKLKSLNMIDERTSAEVQKKYSETGEIKYNEYDDKDLVSYHQWSTKSSIEIVRGKEKTCMKTVKEEIKSTKEEIVIEFEKQLGPFNEHCKNIVSQYNAIKELKSNMKKTEALLHFDYSENYGCKYAEEVQSAHFGGSKSQVTLHTSVLYYKNEAGDTVHKCFCTFSASLRHDPVAVCAHLDPVLKNAKDIIQDLDVIHFLSDGPVTQYRNKKMFNLLATYISKQLQVKEIIWHFTEAGHGKGAPDGVGGSIKRAADGIVARGNDIPNIDELVRLLKNTNTKNELYVVSQEDIEKLDSLLPAEPILPFKGTMAVHQLAWNSESPLEIQARRLSCLKCSTLENCVHYGIGKIQVTGQIQNNATASTKLRYAEVYSDSDEDSDDNVEDNLMNSFVIVQFKTKGSHKHYIGIIQNEEEDGLYRVKFMKKKSANLFVFPDKEDISYVHKGDIIKSVSYPNMGRRGESYEFDNKDIKKFHSTLH